MICPLLKLPEHLHLAFACLVDDLLIDTLNLSIVNLKVAIVTQDWSGEAASVLTYLHFISQCFVDCLSRNLEGHTEL